MWDNSSRCSDCVIYFFKCQILVTVSEFLHYFGSVTTTVALFLLIPLNNPDHIGKIHAIDPSCTWKQISWRLVECVITTVNQVWMKIHDDHRTIGTASLILFMCSNVPITSCMCLHSTSLPKFNPSKGFLPFQGSPAPLGGVHDAC